MARRDLADQRTKLRPSTENYSILEATEAHMKGRGRLMSAVIEDDPQVASEVEAGEAVLGVSVAGTAGVYIAEHSTVVVLDTDS